MRASKPPPRRGWHAKHFRSNANGPWRACLRTNKKTLVESYATSRVHRTTCPELTLQPRLTMLMRHIIRAAVFSALIFSSVPHAVRADTQPPPPKKIVLIAGKKSHGP